MDISTRIARWFQLGTPLPDDPPAQDGASEATATSQPAAPPPSATPPAPAPPPSATPAAATPPATTSPPPPTAAPDLRRTYLAAAATELQSLATATLQAEGHPPAVVRQFTPTLMESLVSDMIAGQSIPSNLGSLSTLVGQWPDVTPGEIVAAAPARGAPNPPDAQPPRQSMTKQVLTALQTSRGLASALGSELASPAGAPEVPGEGDVASGLPDDAYLRGMYQRAGLKDDKAVADLDGRIAAGAFSMFAPAAPKPVAS